MPGFSDLTSEAGLVAQAVCAEADSTKQGWVLAAFVYLLRASPKTSKGVKAATSGTLTPQPALGGGELTRPGLRPGHLGALDVEDSSSGRHWLCLSQGGDSRLLCWHNRRFKGHRGICRANACAHLKVGTWTRFAGKPRARHFELPSALCAQYHHETARLAVGVDFRGERWDHQREVPFSGWP